MLQYLTFGLVDGAFLLLATLGFALVRRVHKFLNIAHATYMAAGAFTTWALSFVVGLSFPLAAVLAVLFVAFLGLAVGRFVYEPILSRGPETLLIVSVGVAFLIQGTIAAAVSPGVKSYPLLSGTTTWHIGTIRTDVYQVVTVCVAIVAVVGLYGFLSRTTTGAAIRAIADNRELAEIRGVDVRRASTQVWLISSTLAGTAGVVLGFLGTLSTGLAFQQVLLIIAVAILAGLGSIYGVAIAALALGLAMDTAVTVIPTGYRSAIAFAVVLLVLIVRPQGIFGRAG